MRKLRLKQPYASMVLCGAWQTIPNVWGYVPQGEKIYIYAEEVDACFENGLDTQKELHQKISNEMVLGNIPDEEFDCNSFLGYVCASHTSHNTNHWSGQASIMYVSHPHLFYQPVEGYDTGFDKLESQRKHTSTLNRMYVENNTLKIPVSKHTWELVNHLKPLEYLYLFWEPYMGQLFSSLADSDEKPGDNVDEVTFFYKKNEINFAGCSVGFSFLHQEFILAIEVGAINHGTTLEQMTDHKEEPPEKKERSEYVHLITTPMGGMTKWKRK